jgi:hypothetical protein
MFLAMNPKVQIRIVGRLIVLAVMVCSLVSSASAEWKEKVLYSFRGGTDGSLPGGGVVFDKAGNLYGVTVEGGSTACPPGWCGTIYQLSPPAQKGGAWTETVLYVFKGHNQNDGSSPSGGLIADSAGNLYGVTGYGGGGPCVLFGTATGCGTVFELSPPKTKGGAWTEKVLYNFQGGKDGDLPSGPLVFDSAGNLYGATEFGGGKGTTCDSFYGGNCGTVFKLIPSKTKGGKWTEKMLHRFAGGTDGAIPNGGLVLDSRSTVYGTTLAGGNQGCHSSYGIGCGTAFEVTPPANGHSTWRETLIHRFTGNADGGSPLAGLTLGKNGDLSGTAAGGGSQGLGVVFQLVARSGGRWIESVLHNFTDNIHGRGPASPLAVDGLGNLYSSALGGEHFRGVLFRLSPQTAGADWMFSDTYSFAGPPDGSYPVASFIYHGGRIYSTTQGGGTGQECQGGCGTVFDLDP